MRYPGSVAMMAASRNPVFRREDLGVALLANWRASVASSITQSGGLISAWTDIIGSRTVIQNVGGSKPVYSATSMNGRPGAGFDGIDDFMQRAGAHGFPTGASPWDAFASVRQTAALANTQSRNALEIGHTSNQVRRIRRVNNGTTIIEALRNQVGTGAATAAVDTTVGQFYEYKVAHVICTGTQILASQDGVNYATLAAVPSTSATIITFGGNFSGANDCWMGVIAEIMVCTELTAAQRLAVINMLKTEGGF